MYRTTFVLASLFSVLHRYIMFCDKNMLLATDTDAFCI